jgi:transglutaminase-like putative cysteine protease
VTVVVTRPRRRLTLGLAHELGLCASLTSATLIVLLGGVFPPWVWLAAFAPTLSFAMARNGIAAPGFSGTLLGIAAIGAGIATIVRGGVDSAVLAGGSTLLGLLSARILTRQTLAHDQQSILLGLVLVLAGSVLNVGLSYFLVLVAYAVSTVWALSTRQLLAGAEQTAASSTGHGGTRPRDREDVITPLFFAASGAVSLGVLGAAVVVFVSFPRIGFGELGAFLHKESKLPASVGFGGNPRGLSTSTDVIARVRGVPADSFFDGLYLRGIVYDRITLESFSQSQPDAADAPVVDTRPSIPSLSYDPTRSGRVEVTLMPVAGALLFTLGHTRTALALSGGAANPNRSIAVAGRDRHDELRTYAPLASPLRYELRGSISAPGVVPARPSTAPLLSSVERQRFLDLPATLDPRLRALVETTIRGGPDASAAAASSVTAAGVDTADVPPAERAARLRRYLLTNFRYSLDNEVTGASEPLKAFLLDAKAGHCELFAGGFALLLRMAGVPARVVGGFQGGALADDDSVVFQMRHAHAWVEWWNDDVGWVVDDATPESGETRERLAGLDALVEGIRRFWDDRVVDYALDDQQDALRRVSQAVAGRGLGSLLTGAVVVVVVGASLVALWRRWLRRASAARQGDRLTEELVAAVARLTGEPPSSTSTLREATAGLAPAVLRDAVDACERVRFGGEALPAAHVQALVDALRSLTPPKAAAADTRARL